MRLNEYEISSVSDTASSAVQKLENTKKKSSIDMILASVKSFFSVYVLILYENRKSFVNLSLNFNISILYNFFSLFMSSQMLIIISEHINIKEKNMTAEKIKNRSKKRT